MSGPARTPRPRAYTDAAVYQQERRTIFARAQFAAWWSRRVGT